MVSNNKIYIILFCIIVSTIILLKIFPNGTLKEGIDTSLDTSSLSGTGSSVSLPIITILFKIAGEFKNFPSLKNSDNDYMKWWGNLYLYQIKMVLALIGAGFALIGVFIPFLMTLLTIIFFVWLFKQIKEMVEKFLGSG
jgi:hypothetical protein